MSHCFTRDHLFFPLFFPFLSFILFSFFFFPYTSVTARQALPYLMCVNVFGQNQPPDCQLSDYSCFNDIFSFSLFFFAVISFHFVYMMIVLDKPYYALIIYSFLLFPFFFFFTSMLYSVSILA